MVTPDGSPPERSITGGASPRGTGPNGAWIGTEMTESVPETLDLDACDREAIHLIGAVQPHGAIISAEAASRRITHASANLGDIVGVTPADCLGTALDALIPEPDLAALYAQNLVPARPEILRSLPLTLRQIGGRLVRAECMPHLSGGQLMLEFLPIEPAPGEFWQQEALRQRIVAELVRADTLEDLAEVSAAIVRNVTGFDRVMIYRFAADKHGQVIAESTEREDRFLGQHYPASDIPEPARRHFVLNLVRTIADIRAPGASIEAEPGAAPLDLTYSKLRAVPRVHVEYLSNMGVRASCSISLVTNDELWGLIACHHYAPRQLAPSQIRFLELIGGTLSALLQGIETRATLARSIEAERMAYDMEVEGRGGVPLDRVVERWGPRLMEAVGARGMVFRRDGRELALGRVPEPALSYDMLHAACIDGIATSDRLGATLGMTDAQREVAAGAAYLELSETGEDALVLLRPHHAETVRWAGKPDKVVSRESDGTSRLSPRGSFAVWCEERVGRSRPFDATDREVLRILRRALFALTSLERAQSAQRAQAEAEREEERLRLELLEASRRNALGELASAIAHEMNQPLAAIMNYISACRQELRNSGLPLPDPIEEIMGEAVHEASRAADLIRRLRDFMSSGVLSPEQTDLAAAARQGLKLALLTERGQAPEVDDRLGNDLPPVWADPVQITQVILNLATNACAAMRDADRRVLLVESRRDDPNVEIALEDSGTGIGANRLAALFEPFQPSTTSGMGIGLWLCRSIVEAHGGRIWHERPKSGSGARMVVSLPIARLRHGG